MNYGTDSWEEINEHTVQLNMAFPHDPVLSQLTIPSNSIANKDVVEQYGYDWPREIVEGTSSGAYRFAEYIPGDRLILEQNEYYWGEKPEIQKINWRFITDASSATVALQNGEIDSYNYVPTLDLSVLEAVDGITVEGQENVGMIYLYCNVDENNQSSPISNKLVRQAITYAIDRDALLMLGCEGDGYTTSTLIPNEFNGYDASYEVAQDVEKAKALMSEAGYADGCKLVLTLSPEKHVAFSPIAEGLQTQLSEIGIELELKTVDSATADSLAWAHEYGDIGMNVIYAAVEDPQYVQYYSVGSLELGTLNFSGYSNPELDDIMSQSRQASGEEQSELVKQSTEISIEDSVCIRVCNGGKNRYAYRSDRWWVKRNWNER
ncbi:MAG: ABC transporter substrate-binding protein, partial [Lactobacillus sp.]|nr:ABC transporter substrate-binding protein [Lactobacillus sp.]